MTVHATPTKGLAVINPATGKPLPPDGSPVPRNVYWLRRAKYGEVKLTKVKAKAKAKTENPK